MSTAIIVEDEPLLRAELRDHLFAQWPELQIVAEAEHGVEALRLIGQHQANIVFLDIQIPGINGLDLAQHIPEGTQIVFVTAYAEHALRAFETGAVDYLVKPIDAHRIATTVRRLKARTQAPKKLTSEEWQRALPTPNTSYLKWIKASVGDTVRLIMVDEVLYFSSSDKYTRVVTKTSEAIIRLTLKNLIEQLDSDRFTQIHRGTIVNLQAIDRIERIDGGMYIYLRDRTEKLPVSESLMKQFRQM
ncbi:MAG: response regulator transcription factor [Burkholderiales bacterium]|nr:response regulator transcription factor [Burkholderiales bacterium]